MLAEEAVRLAFQNVCHYCRFCRPGRVWWFGGVFCVWFLFFVVVVFACVCLFVKNLKSYSVMINSLGIPGLIWS